MEVGSGAGRAGRTGRAGREGWGDSGGCDVLRPLSFSHLWPWLLCHVSLFAWPEMLILSSGRFTRVSLASPCPWPHHVPGLPKSLASPCPWPHRVLGLTMSLASPCPWSHRVQISLWWWPCHAGSLPVSQCPLSCAHDPTASVIPLHP